MKWAEDEKNKRRKDGRGGSGLERRMKGRTEIKDETG
jgi:hypothetical protein